jgi:excisionase family DNA binding protein
MMAAEPTKAIYVRVPAGLADRLDRVSERLGMSKRDIITRLVGDRLEVDDALQPIRIWEDDSPRGTGHVAAKKEPHPDVLSLEEAATLLRVEADDIKEMAEAGELPGRKLGSQWRFSRTALMNWLQAQ